MEMAKLISRRSTCMRRQVGAVIVQDRHLVASGYNGAPRGLPHCEDLGGCLREKMGIPSGERHELCRALHAEQNAIIQAARYGIDISGSSIYVTTQPCVTCAKMIINAGIVEIVYTNPYDDELALSLLAEAGIKVRVFDA